MEDSTTRAQPTAETDATAASGKAVETETSWMAPDPPPIPDRIQKKVSPKRALPKPRLPKFSLAHFMKRYVAILAGGVVLIAFTFWLTRPNEFNPEQQERWSQLCLDYHNWYADFSRGVDGGNRTMLREAGLADVLAEVGARESNPRVIADVGNNVSLLDLAEDPPAAARREAAIEQTRLAAVSLARVEREFEQWPVRLALTEAAQEARRSGWSGVAGYLEAVLTMSPPKSGVPVGRAVPAMQRALGEADGLFAAQGELAAMAEALSAADDAVLSAWVADGQGALFKAFKDEPGLTMAEREERFLALIAKANARLAYGRRLVMAARAGAWDRIDHEAFRENGRSYAMLANGDADLDEVVQVWLEEVGRYQSMENDWRAEWATKKRAELKDVEQRIAALREQGHASSTALQRRHEALVQRIDEVLASPAVKGRLAELQTERVVIDGAVNDLAGAAGGFAEQLKTDQRITALKEVESIGEPGVRSLAVDAWWVKQRDVLVKRAELSGNAEGMWLEADTTRAALRSLIDPAAGSLALRPVPTYAGEKADPLTRGLIDAVRAAGDAEREAILSRTLEYGVDFDELLLRRQQREYEQLLGKYDALILLARDIERFYHGMYRVEEAALTRDGQGLVQRVVAARKWLESKPDAVVAAADPVLERVEAAVAMDRIDDWATLARIATEVDDPVIALQAWRRMGEVAWPRHAGVMEVEWKVHERFALLVTAMSDAERRRALTREMRDAGHGRWIHAMEVAETAQEVEGLIPLLKRFKIDHGLLSPRARFNAALYHAKQEARDPKTNTTHAVASLVTAGQAMNASEDIAGLVGELQQLTAQGAQPLEAIDTAGPAAVGWVAQPLNERAIVFSRDGLHLTFVRITPEGAAPFYVSTHEVSLGLAFDSVGRAGVWGRFAELLPARQTDRKGPWSWAYHGNPSAKTPVQVNPNDWLGDAASYPADLRHEPPTDRHPMQHVSPAAACLVAELMGCSLPSVQQWQQTLQAYPVPAGELPNLRDTAWARFAIHLAKTQGSDADPAAGVFLPEGYRGDPGNLSEHHQVNDGRLWFEPQPNSVVARPAHLIGNLAEWVTTGRIDTAPLLDDAPADAAKRRAAFNRANADRFAVVGGSALSPPSLDPQRPLAVNLTKADAGYADVGFRLAFTPQRITPAQRIKQLLAQQPYLLGPPPPSR